MRWVRSRHSPEPHSPRHVMRHATWEDNLESNRSKVLNLWIVWEFNNLNLLFRVFGRIYGWVWFLKEFLITRGWNVAINAPHFPASKHDFRRWGILGIKSSCVVDSLRSRFWLAVEWFTISIVVSVIVASPLKVQSPPT